MLKLYGMPSENCWLLLGTCQVADMPNCVRKAVVRLHKTFTWAEMNLSPAFMRSRNCGAKLQIIETPREKFPFVWNEASIYDLNIIPLTVHDGSPKVFSIWLFWERKKYQECLLGGGCGGGRMVFQTDTAAIKGSKFAAYAAAAFPKWNCILLVI